MGLSLAQRELYHSSVKKKAKKALEVADRGLYDFNTKVVPGMAVLETKENRDKINQILVLLSDCKNNRQFYLNNKDKYDQYNAEYAARGRLAEQRYKNLHNTYARSIDDYTVYRMNRDSLNNAVSEAQKAKDGFNQYYNWASTFKFPVNRLKVVGSGYGNRVR